MRMKAWIAAALSAGGLVASLVALAALLRVSPATAAGLVLPAAGWMALVLGAASALQLALHVALASLRAGQARGLRSGASFVAACALVYAGTRGLSALVPPAAVPLSNLFNAPAMAVLAAAMLATLSAVALVALALQAATRPRNPGTAR
jgi:hypothetical protein